MNFPVQERLVREAIDWYRKTPTKKDRRNLLLLSHALYAQSEFAEAIKNLDTAFYWHKKNGDTNGMYWTLTLAFWSTMKVVIMKKVLNWQGNVLIWQYKLITIVLKKMYCGR